MTLAVLEPVDPGFPNEHDRAMAGEASRALARLNGHGRVRVEAHSTDTEEHQTFVLPAHAVKLLTDILSYLADGRTVSVMSRSTALTTQQAADMLNVSRPYLVGLLDKGALAFERVGTHRRVALEDLLAYQKRRAADAEDAMAELAAQAQELGMGY